MTMDKSLRRQGQLVRARNVLTRAERIERLGEEDRWKEGDSPFALPKVRVRRMVGGKKRAKEKEEAEAAAAPEGEEAATEAAGQ
ncbi:MAG: small basic protein [Pirellulales bacterium]